MLSQTLPLLLAFSLVASEAVSFEKVVFSSREEGYHTYRIPALWETESGVLLAFAEGRKNSWRDHGDIDVVLRRSLDGGLSWEAMRVVWSDGENTCGNPTVVQDRDTGRVWLFMTHNLADDTLREITDGTSEGVRTIWSCFSDDDGMTWLHPLQPGAMRGDGAVGLKKQTPSSRMTVGWNLEIFSANGGHWWRVLLEWIPPTVTSTTIFSVSTWRTKRRCAVLCARWCRRWRMRGR